MQPENQPLPDSSSEEESLEDSSADEQSASEPPPVAISPKTLRRRQIDKWIEDLYKTSRSNQQVTQIHQQLVLEKANTTLLDWDETMITETALDTTNGDIALAIAALHKLEDLNLLTGQDFNFVQQPAGELPGAALPLFNLQINGVIVNEGNGEERMKFNQYGDVYNNSDIAGFVPLINYPYR
jgi:hypothetical protein